MSVMVITKDNFEAEVVNSPVPVLLDFWATWCGPCRMVSPIVDEIAEESDGSYKVGKINVDEQPELASAFRVMSIPTLIVMKDGKVYKSSVGMQPKASILSPAGQVTAICEKAPLSAGRGVLFHLCPARRRKKRRHCMLGGAPCAAPERTCDDGSERHQGDRRRTPGAHPADGAAALLPVPAVPAGGGGR